MIAWLLVNDRPFFRPPIKMLHCLARLGLACLQSAAPTEPGPAGAAATQPSTAQPQPTALSTAAAFTAAAQVGGAQGRCSGANPEGC